ncbi:S41 family peptidase [Deinococcus fonticola]|uniref:S41 family peptidase n=1 Tax=Deinococcus fonticola TaxID=2528713 RepID=UPI001074A457|nr:PDZ domain-containing protein [Deinococcus fonticola]
MKRRLKLILVFTLLALPAMSSAVPISANLSGKIVDWPADLKGGEVRLMDWETDAVYATGTVNAQGNFTLQLPELKDKQDNLSAISELLTEKSNYGVGCVGTGKAEPANGKYREFQLILNVDGKDYGDITLNRSANQFPKKGDAWSALLFFTQPVKLEGKITCPTPYSNAEFQGTYPAGWSQVRQEVVQDPKTTQIRASYNAAAPLTGMQWRLFSEFGGVGMNLKKDTLMVDFVREGGPAALAGVQAGDELLSVDGQKVTVMEEALQAIRGEPNTKVVLVVKRDGQEMTFEITRALVRVP